MKRLAVPCAACVLGVSFFVSGASAQSLQSIINGDFVSGDAPWSHTQNVAPLLAEGKWCADVPGGTTNPWDVFVRQGGIAVVAGETYELSFDASASPGPGVARALIQNPTTYATFLEQYPGLSEATRRYSFRFTAASSLPDAELHLQLGGASEPWRFCLDNVALVSGVEPSRYVPETGPIVRVNQVGYLLDGPKRATVVSEATGPLPWLLVAGNGRTVAHGRTQPLGKDATSGLSVHRVVFDTVARSGQGYRLRVLGEDSHPFALGSSLYTRLVADAASLFSIQRSGLEIEESWAGEGYARRAGHVGIAPNLGDTSVGCQSAQASQVAYGQPWTCEYRLDASGGWYDAGDHGKYVVNGGITVAQLMAAFERTREPDRSLEAGLGDGQLRVPEGDNGVPDVLDEARWELEWMLRMQVPQGQPLEAMVHHKLHDARWTGLPLDPAADPQVRELHRPSTAATLNLAAVAAQGARLYRPYDAPFARRLLAAAKRAWEAAQRNPALIAPGSDGTGGGAYSDGDVSDEFYWAASELYLTTREDRFRQALLASPVHSADVFPVGGFAWNSMGALARMDLALYARELPGHRVVRRSVVSAADELLELAARQAWGQPYAPESGVWVWGSNSNLLNNLVVLGVAFDLTGEDKYRRAVQEGMDFVLGRNALNLSFVTGYGSVFSQNQHSRLFTHQRRPELPRPPDGTLAGGPNTSLQDPIAAANLGGCVGQFCYIDDVGSWSTNELAINWNAPLLWVASFLASGTGCR